MIGFHAQHMSLLSRKKQFFVFCGIFAVLVSILAAASCGVLWQARRGEVGSRPAPGEASAGRAAVAPGD